MAKDLDAGQSSARISENMRSANGAAGESGPATHELKVRAKSQPMPATHSQSNTRGIRRAICATSSKPFASPQPEEISHDTLFSASRVSSHSPPPQAWLSVPAKTRLRFLHAPDETLRSSLDPISSGAEHCTACHAADYINTQRAGRNQEGLCRPEVTKMIKVYGAPIDDADIGKIVDYLAATY